MNSNAPLNNTLAKLDASFKSDPGTYSLAGGESSSKSVIVFGFPPSAAAFVLAQFRDFGEITSYSLPTQGSNWVQLTYRTRAQALRAAGRSGTVMDVGGGAGQVMIGARMEDAEKIKGPDDSSMLFGHGSSLRW